jgi:hypothetical protein
VFSVIPIFVSRIEEKSSSEGQENAADILMIVQPALLVASKCDPFEQTFSSISTAEPSLTKCCTPLEVIGRIFSTLLDRKIRDGTRVRIVATIVRSFFTESFPKLLAGHVLLVVGKLLDLLNHLHPFL